MKQIKAYELFDPTDITKKMPIKAPGNYIFLLRFNVILPTDKIAKQPNFKTLTYEGKEYRVLYTQ